MWEPDALADPRGGTYATSLEVALVSEVEGAQVHFTLDGRPPSLASPIASGRIVIAHDTLVTFFAAFHDGRAGPVRTEFYRIATVTTVAAEQGRAVQVEPEILFLATRNILDPVAATVTVRSVGTEPVSVLDARLAEHPDPWFGGADALREFELATLPAAPIPGGQTDGIVVRYRPRVDRQRAALLVVETDAEKAPIRTVTIFGKVFDSR